MEYPNPFYENAFQHIRYLAEIGEILPTNANMLRIQQIAVSFLEGKPVPELVQPGRTRPQKNLPPDGEFDIATGIYTTGTGHKLKHTHRSTTDCIRHGCVIHSPSLHKMRKFRTNWLMDKNIMERVCTHGYGHPDPDHIAWIERTQGKDPARKALIHACDGCCK